jgi:hypothetical protein
MSWLNYQDLAERNRVFAAMVAHRRVVAGLATGAALCGFGASRRRQTTSAC